MDNGTTTLASSDEGGVVPWDYTPYYYLIMASCGFGAVTLTLLANPTMRRTNVDTEKNYSNKS